MERYFSYWTLQNKLKKDKSDVKKRKRLSTDTESESSFHSANDSFLPYDEEIEPIADDEETAEYARQVAIEDDEEQLLLSRFSGEIDVSDW